MLLLSIPFRVYANITLDHGRIKMFDLSQIVLGVLFTEIDCLLGGGQIVVGMEKQIHRIVQIILSIKLQSSMTRIRERHIGQAHTHTHARTSHPITQRQRVLQRRRPRPRRPRRRRHALVRAVRLQLMIDQIVLGLQALGARRTLVPQRPVDWLVHVAHVLPQIARVRVHFGAVRAARSADRAARSRSVTGDLHADTLRRTGRAADAVAAVVAVTLTAGGWHVIGTMG